MIKQLTVNDTHHMEELDLIQEFIEIEGQLLLTFFVCLHDQLGSFNSIILEMSEKHDSQVGSKNEWLLLSETFMAKLKSVSV